MPDTADVVICGAGIAGIATAYHLAVKQGVKRVVIVDERPPLTLTSDKSTECYRNWWPGQGEAMVRLMNRSIDLIEDLARESGNVFQLNRRGYLYTTTDPNRIPVFKQAGERAAAQGAGELRVHAVNGIHSAPYIPAPAHGFDDQPDGADLILDPILLRAHFPYLSENIVAAVHARRCGWFSAQQLGMYLMERAKEHGAQTVSARVESVEVKGRVRAVKLSDGGVISTDVFVNAAGPLLKNVGRMIGVDLPVFSERHAKIAFKDHLGVVPRDAPFIICADPITLDWSDDEREMLAESEETAWMLNELPAGAHLRPEGIGESNILLMLWAYDTAPVPEVFPVSFDPSFPDIVLRGLAKTIPGLRDYFANAPKPMVDGGYYTKTRENRPIVGPLPVQGAFVIGALSGYGIMAACAAGELLAAHITGGSLPSYAPAFALSRYDDPAYHLLLETWDDTGQL